jgi:2-polyprenyl-6-hydroxyphenyl methylase/3-demethylubiquinone-9 3-methyltransferase
MLKTPLNPPCKICASADVSTLYRMHHDYEENPFSLLECRACGFRFIDYLDAAGAGERGDASIDDTAEEVAAGLESSAGRIAANAALLRARLPGGDRAILDVGSGGGGFLLAVRQDYARVMGVELDPRFRAYSRSRGLEIADRPLEDPYWDARRSSYDAVTMWDVIEHVNDPLAVSRRVNALLKPGGVFLIDTPTRDGFFYRFGNLTARLSGGRRPSTMGIQYSSAPFCHKQIFRRRDMKRMLAEAGFSEVRIEQKFELSFPPEYYTRHFIRSRLLRRLVNPFLILGFRLTPIRNKMIVTAVK